MVLEQLQRERVERRLDGTDLRQHVDAVAVLVDHAADAAHLALDAVEALGKRRLVVAHDWRMGRAPRQSTQLRDFIARILDRALECGQARASRDRR